MATDKSVLAVIRASRPSFRNNSDKAAFAVHASFLASGYVLAATGPPAFSDDAFSDVSISDDVCIDYWNELDDHYAFVYISPDNNSRKVLVKCLVMNDKLLVDALAERSANPVHLEINIRDYVTENQEANYNTHYKNLDNLVKILDAEIVSKLCGQHIVLPPVTTSSTSAEATREPSSIQEEPVPQPYTSGMVYPPVPVNPIGASDLYPGPGAGMYPSRGNFGSGGMLLGPNDPRWFGFEGGEPGFPGRPAGVPPGARFDPYGPPGVPGFEPNRIINRPPGRGQGGIHPDLQHFGGGNDFI